jgi:hypothetical protein
MKKWGVQTLSTSSPAFTREGETYTPSTALVMAAGSTTLSLPPDIGEIVRLLCTSDTTTRFIPAQFESQYWVDMEQGAKNQDGTFVLGIGASGQSFYYDTIAERTLAITPPAPVAFSLAIDYTPMKRPLYYSNAGTISITQGATGIVGVGTTWLTDGIFTGASNQRAELLSGLNTLDATGVRLDRDYPVVASITSDTVATLQLPWAPTTVAAGSFILAMVPTLPRVYHRWIARLTSVYMLTKVNPDLSDRYAKQVKESFSAGIAPTANRRQIQDSPITDAESLMGGLATF